VNERVWTVERSAALYGVERWGAGFFSINAEGHVQVHPAGPGTDAVDLHRLVEDLGRRELHTPLLLRFSDVLAARVRALCGSFERAIVARGYRGRYRGVYPIKVNQQRQVVHELVDLGRTHGLGLEVGSKAELLVAIALLDASDALLVCNGYKDRPYIETALLAQRLGRHPVLVIERPHELDTVIKASRELGIRPRLGVRARLAARGDGLWIESSGDRSKFGLPVREIVQVVERLRGEDLLDSLELLHFHMGSQITTLRAHRDALREAAQIFVGLRRMGAGVELVDVGGGLGVDYEGARSEAASSMSYGLDEYAAAVVDALAEACRSQGLAEPDLVTEAGRALVSHASVLVFDVLDVDEMTSPPPRREPAADDDACVLGASALARDLRADMAAERYRAALELKEDVERRFSAGELSLEVRARFEGVYWESLARIAEAARALDPAPPELAPLARTLADTYYGNFSLFQSLPDSWTLGQMFPVMPIHRLDQEPTRDGLIGDLTCDSDGKIDTFVGERTVLPLHTPDSAPYYLGIFLVGAYQETLGEAHNLYGDTDTVHVRVLGPERTRIEEVIQADRVEEVLSYVQYNPGELRERVRRATEEAVERGELTLEQAARFRKRFEEGLAGNTYLERGERSE
jgi:arginine decarboxylase